MADTVPNALLPSSQPAAPGAAAAGACRSEGGGGLPGGGLALAAGTLPAKGSFLPGAATAAAAGPSRRGCGAPAAPGLVTRLAVAGPDGGCDAGLPAGKPLAQTCSMGAYTAAVPARRVQQAQLQARCQAPFKCMPAAALGTGLARPPVYSSLPGAPPLPPAAARTPVMVMGAAEPPPSCACVAVCSSSRLKSWT
jgi:hypothetical protein